MSLSITPGPLPPDGSRLSVQQDLDAFLQGTEISGFDLDNFIDSGAAFVVSATEAPATSSRSRGLSWFKRGEGTLYHWLVFTPTDGPHSGVTQGKWLAASGSRKEILVEARFPVEEAGGVLRQTGEKGPGVYGVHLMAHNLAVPRVYQSLYTSHTVLTAFSDSTSSWLGYWAEHSTDPIFAAKDTQSGDTEACGWSGHCYLAAYEMGYCPLRVCGYTGPGRIVLREGVNTPNFWAQTAVTLNISEPWVGFVLESGASAADGPLFGFLYPSLTHRNV